MNRKSQGFGFSTKNTDGKISILKWFLKHSIWRIRIFIVFIGFFGIFVLIFWVFLHYSSRIFSEFLKFERLFSETFCRNPNRLKLKKSEIPIPKSLREFKSNGISGKSPGSQSQKITGILNPMGFSEKCVRSQSLKSRKS